MKKILAGVITIIMVMSFGITALAAETITEQNGSKDISVQAKAVYVTPDNIYEAIVTDGKATITMKNDAKISISTDSAALDGWTLSVIDMVEKDKDAYAWINDIMSGLCNKYAVYDIYFNDNNGNRVNVTDEVTVSITTPDGYSNVQLYYIGSSAKPDEVSSKQSGSNTVFTTTGLGYYVLADKVAVNGDTTDTANSSASSTVITGDTSNMTLWIVLLFVSVGALSLVWVSQKRKKADRK